MKKLTATVVCFFLLLNFSGLVADEDLETAKKIDQLLETYWSSHDIQPAEIASDSEFLRRVTLDLIGVVPPVGDAREFLENPNAQKRTTQVDRLLNSPRFSTHLANTFRDIILPAGSTDTPGRTDGLQQWLRRQFVNDMRYDRIVSEFLSATGNEQEGPAVFYRVLEAKPEKLAATTARVFLGLQIECAQCHDHPFDEWSQHDFWGYAAFFAQIQAPAMDPTAFRLVDLKEGDVTLPETDKVVTPKYPRGRLADENDGGSRRIQLSIWMASRDNPFLPKAAVNRVWSLMFGKGLVDPVDDLGPHNPPSHPEVMEELTKHFVKSGFQLRSVFRVIANTKVYQRSSIAKNSDGDIRCFERMYVKTMSPDQLFDSLGQSMILPSMASNPQFRREFVSRMGSVAVDRTQYASGLQQALNIMNGAQVDNATKGRSNGLLTALEAPFLNDQQRIESLFLATLTRIPNENERSVYSNHLAEQQSPDDRKSALGDMLWALVNSAEFQLNH